MDMLNPKSRKLLILQVVQKIGDEKNQVCIYTGEKKKKGNHLYILIVTVLFLLK